MDWLLSGTLKLGAGFALGFLFAWIIGLGQGPVSKEVIRSVIDTVYVASKDTVRLVDTNEVIHPVTVYRARIVRDTTALDSMRAIIEQLKQYVAEKTFQDSAWVRHTWLMTPDWLVKENRWDYRAAPRTQIYFRDTVEVKPTAMKKIFYGAGLFAAGGAAALVVNNNK